MYYWINISSLTFAETHGDEVAEDLLNLHRKGAIDSVAFSLTYTPELLEQRIYPSLWLPIPYMEVRKAPGIEQNQGWENWK